MGAHPEIRHPRVGRRAFARLLLGAAGVAMLAGDRQRSGGARALPVPVDHSDLARYLAGLDDLPTPAWSLLAVTAGVLDPGRTIARDLVTRLPAGVVRGAARGWAFRAEADRMRAILAAAQRVYAATLPPARAALHHDRIERERGRLARSGQVDYLGVAHLVTEVNREWGLMDRLELEQLDLARRHRLDPLAFPRDVAALLAERRERRALATAFRAHARRLLGSAPQRLFDTPAGPLTLLADLGRPATAPRGYQLIRARLPDVEETTIAARAVLYTAGEFLALEPPAPPDSWADSLPPDQRAQAPANALSARLDRAAIVAPGHASRVLWPPLQDCRAVAAELGRL